MNERWTTVDRLLEAALDRAPDDRAAFLREACPDDEALRQEVEALLTHATSAGDFLERPALELLGSVLVEGDNPSLLGRQLGPHRILSLLAIGGMGEVYRARDTRLNRDVAIKVLPEQLALDPDRLARLQTRSTGARLAQSSATSRRSTGSKQADGVQALVLELVEGPTLADRIAARTHSTRRSDAYRATDCRSVGGGARAGNHPSRPEAGQHQGPRRRHGEGAGFRVGQGAGAGGRRIVDRLALTHYHHACDDTGGHHSRHGGLHESGAGEGEAGRQAQRLVGVRLRAL